MPTPDWADKIASKRWSTAIVRKIYAISLRAEHRRTLRIVQTVAGAVIEDSMDADQYDAYMQACSDILAALKRGR